MQSKLLPFLCPEKRKTLPGIAFVFFLLITSTSFGMTITVNTDLDVVANEGLCSLREAINASIDKTASGNFVGECQAGTKNVSDTINFELPLPATIVLNTPLYVAGLYGFDIIGPGRDQLTIIADSTQAFVLQRGNFTFTGFTITGGWNNSYGTGGALYAFSSNLTLRGMRFTDSRATSGGAVAVLVHEGESLVINDCVFTNNVAFRDPGSGRGGALYLDTEGSGLVDIKNSTFSNNSAEGLNLGNGFDGFGGAIFIRGKKDFGSPAQPAGTVNITRSTFSGNLADWEGAAISAGDPTNFDFDGHLSISHSTIYANQTSEHILGIHGSTIYVETPFGNTGIGSFSLVNTIVSSTRETYTLDLKHDFKLLLRPDQLIKKSYNFIGFNDDPLLQEGLPNGANSWVGGNNNGALDPDLGPLTAAEGGYTEIHYPNVNSSVIDQGRCDNEIHDQRSFQNTATSLRAVDDLAASDGAAGFCDIGAVETGAMDDSNFPPTLVEDYYHLDLNTALSTTDASGGATVTIQSDNGLLANDEDLDGDILVLTNTGVQALGNGSLELFADGTFTFSGHDINTELSFDYNVSDGTQSRTQTATIDLKAIPTPRANSDSYTTAFNTALVTTDTFGGNTADINDNGVLANDMAGATGAVFEATVMGIGGTLVDNGVGTFTYTPPPGVSGIASIGYFNVGIAALGDNHATVTIFVQAQSVSAQDDAYALRYDQSLNIDAIAGVLANDLNNPTLTTPGSFTASPLGGSVNLAVDGSFTYTPSGTATGVDVFTYSVDDNGMISTARVSVNVTSPVAVSDSYTLLEDDTLVADDLTGTVNTGNDDGVLVNDVPVGVETVISTGSLPLSGPGGNVIMAADGSFSYTPPANAYGTGTLEYDVQDDNGLHTAQLEITVTPVNDPPEFVAGADVSLPTVSGPETITAWATAISAGPNEFDQQLTFTLTPAGFSGGLTFVSPPVISADGDLSFELQPGTSGSVNIDVVLEDDLGGTSAQQSFTISINPVNNAPVANPDGYSALEDEVLYVSGIEQPLVTANDSDPEGNSLQVTSTGLQTATGIGGDVFLFADGSFYYKAPADMNGVDTFDYTVSDGVLSATATVTITVAEKNDKPELTDDPQTGVFLEDSVLPALNIQNDIFVNDTPGPNESMQTLTLVAVGEETGGTASSTSTEVQFTLEADFNGLAFFRYQAIDDGTTAGVSDIKLANALVGYTITAVNDAPSFTKGGDFQAPAPVTDLVVNLDNWASQLSPGPADEAGQTITFELATSILSGNLSFVALPTLDPVSLKLSFTVTANTTGLAEVSIVARDDGGTANGGVDQSPPQTLMISIGSELIFGDSFE